MEIKIISQNSRIKSAFFLLLLFTNFMFILNSHSLSLFYFAKNFSLKKIIKSFLKHYNFSKYP